jgi:RHS repeat-associated protein
VGNITHIEDTAQQAIFFSNVRVDPSAGYTYDALYRLIEASGREHLGQGAAPIPHSHDDAFRRGLLHPGDGSAMGTYVERYIYDAVGNLLEMRHRGSNPVHAGWTRGYTYNEPSVIESGVGGLPLKTSNRLSDTSVAVNNPPVERCAHDTHGNVIRLAHLAGLDPGPNVHWDCRDQPRQFDLGGGGTVYCVYDSSGQRIRKVWEHSATLVEERIYLGAFEIFRKRQGADRLERETFHVMDDQRRVAIVETRTLDTAGSEPGPPQLVRYQFGNHLGSASLELDDQAQVLSYEEHTPYGSTSYQAVRSQTQTPKRYRYTGKERDEETGLCYHGARYYAPWLARWISCDPLGVEDGVNVYEYVGSNPITRTDPTGQQQIANDLDPSNPSNFVDFQSFEAARGETESESLCSEETYTTWTTSHAIESVAPTGESSGSTTSSASDGSHWHNPLGSGLVTVWDTTQRMTYISTIREASADAVAEIRATESLDDAERIARDVSTARNATRTAAQGNLTTGSRLMSEALDPPRNWGTVFEKYGNTRSFETFERIAEGAGRSNPNVTRLATLGKFAGPIAVGTGVVVSGVNVYQATPEDRPRVAVEELGATGGGAVGASLGTAGGVGLATLIAGALGLSGPPGWLVIGLGLVGGGVGGYGGSEAGRRSAVPLVNVGLSLGEGYARSIERSNADVRRPGEYWEPRTNPGMGHR